MARPIVLGNGSMLVGINLFGLVHDFYYPYVGLENHAAGRRLRHRIGVWVENEGFSWLDDGGWLFEFDYFDRALVGRTKASSDRLGLELTLEDFVDHEVNAFCRRIEVRNARPQEREIRLFLHQALHIANSDQGDTCVYLPRDHVIMHYKGRRVFTVYGQHDDRSPFDQYSIGIHGIEGREGTYRDAEDGDLAGNPVEHGRVDSTLRFTLKLGSEQTGTVRYWICAAATKEDAIDIHSKLLGAGFDARLRATQEAWQDWLLRSDDNLARVDQTYADACRKSLLIIKSHIDRRGAVLASGDSQMLNYERDNYSYCWPRDAVYALWPLVRLGYREESERFFEFCRDVLSPDGYVMHKYQPDRAVGSTWHPYVRNGKEELPIQEDETAAVVYLLGEYLRHIKNEEFVYSLFPTLVRPAANFMDSYIDSATKLPHASYDLWEQKFLTTTYSTSLVYAALKEAALMADRFEYPDDAMHWRQAASQIKEAAATTLFNDETGYFYKGFMLGENGMLEFDSTIDSSSLYGAVMYGLFDKDDESVKKSVATLKDRLYNSAPAGGVPRYEGDAYYASPNPFNGNPWFVTTLWLAQFYCENEQRVEAEELLAWVHKHMLKSGVLSEQINTETGHFIGVAPLIWSQAEFINTVLDLAS